MKRPVERISTAELSMLAGGVAMGTVFLPISSILARLSGSDSTLGLLMAAAFVIPYAYWVVHPSVLTFPRKALTAQLRLAFGEVIGRGLALIIGVALVAFACGLARQIGDVYILSLMPRTPAVVFSLMVIGLSTAMALEGTEVLARYAVLVFPTVMVTLILLFLATSNMISVHNFLPPLEYGIMAPLRTVYRVMAYSGEMVVIIWSVLPVINQPRGANAAMLKGATGAAFGLALVNIAAIGAFSAPETARLFYATIDLAKMIQSGGYIRGLESIVVGIFTAASVLKVCAFLLAGSHVLADACNVRDYRRLVIPFAVAITVGTLLLRDATRMTRLVDWIDATVMAPAFLALAPLVRVVGVWQYRRRRARAQAS